MANISSTTGRRPASLPGRFGRLGVALAHALTARTQFLRLTSAAFRAASASCHPRIAARTRASVSLPHRATCTLRGPLRLDRARGAGGAVALAQRRGCCALRVLGLLERCGLLLLLLARRELLLVHVPRARAPRRRSPPAASPKAAASGRADPQQGSARGTRTAPTRCPSRPQRFDLPLLRPSASAAARRRPSSPSAARRRGARGGQRGRRAAAAAQAPPDAAHRRAPRRAWSAAKVVRRRSATATAVLRRLRRRVATSPPRGLALLLIRSCDDAPPAKRSRMRRLRRRAALVGVRVVSRRAGVRALRQSKRRRAAQPCELHRRPRSSPSSRMLRWILCARGDATGARTARFRRDHRLRVQHRSAELRDRTRLLPRVPAASRVFATVRMDCASVTVEMVATRQEIIIAPPIIVFVGMRQRPSCRGPAQCPLPTARSCSKNPSGAGRARAMALAGTSGVSAPYTFYGWHGTRRNAT